MNARHSEDEAATGAAFPPDGLEYEHAFVYRGKTVAVRWTAHHWHDRDGRANTVALGYDASGRFYAITQTGKCGSPIDARAVQLLTGKDAFLWFVHRFALDKPFAEALCRAISAPEFEFMPSVATAAKRPRKRAAKKPAPVFAVQLELATALVSVVEKLNAAPSLETVSEACRVVSKLHQSLHAEATFKLAANS